MADALPAVVDPRHAWMEAVPTKVGSYPPLRGPNKKAAAGQRLCFAYQAAL
ncbi:hypothetical protein I5U90_15160 [Stenotrophomonas maltophilia]|uniref:hypothetical protein n=1 Tax=Stenotrophomonas TaxID=40323 RepID=UPI000A4C2F60|nr:hypothetical protein [Stenotrophomonas sp. GD03948]MBH1674361.1 hypothetical protein [Stenotrophomonas maltophilia]MDH1242923.1 hypothetical protein [Stenotrophomonas sp. GD03948]